MRSLYVANGPIEQLEGTLAKLLQKLEPKSGLAKIRGSLLWPFDRKEVEVIMGQVERQNSTINYALQGDQMNLQRAIKADTEHIPDLVHDFQSIKVGMDSTLDRHQGISALILIFYQSFKDNQILHMLSSRNTKISDFFMYSVSRGLVDEAEGNLALPTKQSECTLSFTQSADESPL